MVKMESKKITPHLLTPHFHITEFACKDGHAVPAHLLSNVRALAVNLEVIRAQLGSPIIINSGYRTPAYNNLVGGALASQHLLANAVDIVVKGFSPFFVFCLLRLICVITAICRKRSQMRRQKYDTASYARVYQASKG